MAGARRAAGWGTRWLYIGAVLVLLAVSALSGTTETGNVAAAEQFRVRVLLAVADLSGADVWIDDNQIATNAAFRDVTAYASYTAGDYTLRVFPPGRTARSQAYVDTSFRFQEPKDYTIVVRGTRADNTIRVTVETDRNTREAESARVRFGNALVGTNETTLAIAGVNTVLGRAKYGETDEYTSVAPGTYELFLTDGSGVITKGSVTLSANTVVSVFAIGTRGGADAATPALLFSQDNPAGGTATVLRAAPVATDTPTVFAGSTSVIPTVAGAVGNAPIFTTTPAPTQAPLYTAPSTPSPLSTIVVSTTAASTTTVSTTAAFTTVTSTTPVATTSFTTTFPTVSTVSPPFTPTPAGNPALRQALRPVPMVANTPTRVWYAATGHTLGGPFKRYWEAKGGLEQFGFPISEEYQEMSLTDGRMRTVQYFERARFELHPDKAGTPFEVQQGLLGREILKLLGT